MELPDGIFDKQALLHARRAIEKAEHGAKTWLVAPLATDLFDPAAVFTVGGTVRFPDDLAAALKERGCTHVIAFTRLRADANLRAFNSRLGDGQLEGLGFYLDRVTPIKNVDSLVSGVGFVAPYFYVRASLLDAASGRVQAMQRITEGEAIGADTAAQAGDPWGSLPNSTKVQLLNNLVESQVLKAVPQLLAVR
jgi:hypothetical protein